MKVSRRIWLALVGLLPGAAQAQTSIPKPRNPERVREPARVKGLGIKVGEPTADSVRIWTRVPRTDESAIHRKRDLTAFLAALFNFEPDLLVRLRWSTREDLSGAVDTGWQEVEEDDDFTRQFEITGLEPGREYFFEARAAFEDRTEAYPPRRGRWRTAPAPDESAPVRFTVMTCQAYHHLDHPDGFHIYPSMERLAPHFHVATGDSVYYDRGRLQAKRLEIAREHWRRMYELPRLFEFHARTPTYWEKDDHDLFANDHWPGRRNDLRGELTYDEALKVFREHSPVPRTPYRTIRWGRHVQIWLTEGREFRSENRDPDGPDKTIYGAEQKAWLKRTLLASDADWRILINPTPLVGPDRSAKGDNHANDAFRHEGEEMRRWFTENLGDNFVVLCGDRHWQYHSADPETGLEELCCGPTSDVHAGGSPGFDSEMHRFHRVAGGFLSVDVEPDGAASVLRLRLHDVHGEVLHERVRRRDGPATA